MQTAPKTIIITTFNGGANLQDIKSKNFLIGRRTPIIGSQRPPSSVSLKRPLPRMYLPPPSPCPSADSSSYYDDMDDIDSESDFEFQPPRKRERLNHLTPEEKMYRRKLKNRIAAQTARDRKKIQMYDLEDRIKRLETENELLRNQNNKLSTVSNDLCDENSRLKSELLSLDKNVQKSTFETKVEQPRPISAAAPDSTTTDLLSAAEIGVVDCNETTTIAFESAAFINGLQQQGQAIGALVQSAASKCSNNHPLILFLAVVTAMNNYSIGCETFSSKNFKAIYVQQRENYNTMEPLKLAQKICQEIQCLKISNNGKRLLLKKLEELLRCRKISKLKDCSTTPMKQM